VLVGIGVNVDAAPTIVVVAGKVEVAASVPFTDPLSVGGAVGKANVAVGVASGCWQPVAIKMNIKA
jgi:hypothetical protein